MVRGGEGGEGRERGRGEREDGVREWRERRWGEGDREGREGRWDE